VDEASVERLLAEQREYYRERAHEYDHWWFHRGDHALDTETAARWFADVRELEAFGPRGDVLELPGPGSGLGTSSSMRIA
jgi:hypothetical protein